MTHGPAPADPVPARGLIPARRAAGIAAKRHGDAATRQQFQPGGRSGRAVQPKGSARMTCDEQVRRQLRLRAASDPATSLIAAPGPGNLHAVDDSGHEILVTADDR